MSDQSELRRFFCLITDAPFSDRTDTVYAKTPKEAAEKAYGAVDREVWYGCDSATVFVREEGKDVLVFDLNTDVKITHTASESTMSTDGIEVEGDDDTDGPT